MCVHPDSLFLDNGSLLVIPSLMLTRFAILQLIIDKRFLVNFDLYNMRPPKIISTRSNTGIMIISVNLTLILQS